MFVISTARLTAKYQYFDGSNDDVNQFLDIVTIDCHALSTRPFCCCRLGGAPSISVPLAVMYFSTSPWSSFGSKSVRRSFGVVLQSL